MANWRYLPTEPGQPRVEDPDFVLNQPAFRHASILIAGSNFGSGSSREMAVWSVRQFGFRGVIAPSFGTIFQNNCYRNGVVPVTLALEDVQRLGGAAEAGNLQLTIDLDQGVILQPDGTRLSFSTPSSERAMLLEGLDVIGLTLKRRTDIESFQAKDRVARPWICANPKIT